MPYVSAIGGPFGRHAHLILEIDLPHINHIDVSQIVKLKKLLYLLATNVPFILNITDIAKATNISRPKVYEYLERAKVINSIKSKEKGYNIMAKSEKLFMKNTNISYAITSIIDTGSAREAFFVNQIKNALDIQTRLMDDRIFTAKKR